LLVWRIQICLNTITRTKDIGNDPKESNVAAHHSGKGYNAFPNYLESIIITHSSMFVENHSKSAETPHTTCQGEG